MSKSLDNTIHLSDTPEEIHAKIKTAFTDPSRKRRSDPGHPEICLIYTYWQKFAPENQQEIHQSCTSADIGCVDCKLRVAEAITTYLAPFHEKRRELEKHPETVDAIIDAGDKKARERAQETIASVREKIQVG